MLEGKELVQKIGEYGEASVDVTPQLEVVVEIKAKVNLLEELKKMAAKTATPYDDQALAWVESVLNAFNALPKA